MRRGWSIGTRTALTFAVASMLLVTGVLVFVNLASQQSLSAQVLEPAGSGAVPDRVPGITFDPDSTDAGSGRARVVSLVAQQQWQWSAVAVAVAGLLAGAIGWAVSRRMLRPIDRIAATTERISASTLHERIDLEGPDDELRRLSRTIDALLDRLDTAFAAQRRFVAQASHELRTPLAVQRAAVQIDLCDDAGPDEIARVREELLAQNRRTEHLVESLLVLAEAERGLESRGEEVRLDALLDEVVEQYRISAATTGVVIRVDLDASAAAVRGEPVLIRQLVANLVDNAVEYNVDGGTVWVRSSGSGFAVENTGPVVAAETVARLVEPFRRASGNGTKRHSGLGLSIVTAIADAHGWQVDVRARAGGGLAVLVGVSSVQRTCSLSGNLPTAGVVR